MTMTEGQHWFALLEECAKRHALELERVEKEKAAQMARADLLQEKLFKQQRDLDELKRDHKRMREMADKLHVTVSVATANMFADHTLVTKPTKADIIAHVQEQHDQWHGLFTLF